MPNKPIRENSKQKINNILPKILILAGIIIVIVVMLVLKNQQVEQTVAASEQAVKASAEPAGVQLEHHLEAGRPTFVFFHSNNCQSCLDMIAVVNQVYPDFEKEVALVDVDVYDQANQTLLQQAQIRSIPTQVFITAAGVGSGIIGVMTVDALREQLEMLAAGVK